MELKITSNNRKTGVNALSYKNTKQQPQRQWQQQGPLKCIVMLENGSQTHSQVSPLTCLARPCHCYLTLGVFISLVNRF